MPKCDFNKVAKQLFEIILRHGYSSVNLLHIARTNFPKKTSAELLLQRVNPPMKNQKYLLADILHDRCS